MPFVPMVKIDTTTQRELSKRFTVRSVPTLVFLKSGEEVWRNAGTMTVDELKSTLSELFY
jgi:thioredoxin-like negative regulator of GroEL